MSALVAEAERVAGINGFPQRRRNRCGRAGKWVAEAQPEKSVDLGVQTRRWLECPPFDYGND